MLFKKVFAAVAVAVVYLLLFAVVDQLTSAFISTGAARYISFVVVISAVVLTYDFVIGLLEKKKSK